MRRLMSKTNPLLHRLCRNNIKPLHPYHRSQTSSLRHISIHRISIHDQTHKRTTTIQTSIRTFCDRKTGSFTQPTKKQKPTKSTDAESETEETKPFNPVIHSKAVSKTMHSSTKTRTLNSKVETVQQQTISHNTQINNGADTVKLTFSQQSEKRSETDHEDPSQDTVSSTTSTYKRMDVNSEDGTDSHTEITSTQESLSAADTEEHHVFDNDLKANEDYDIYTVGNPSTQEIEWRRSMMNPNALIIHPDRLLPVPMSVETEDARQKGWRYWKRKVQQTFTSVRERIIDNDTFNDYTHKMKQKTDTISDSYDTSQNYHLVKVRGMLDRLNMQTESSKAMQIIQDDFHDFWVEDFLPLFDNELCPLIVRAYLNDDLDFLNTVCVGEAQVFCKNMIEQRIAENKMMAPDILWIHDADLLETKLHNKKPQLIIRADVQCIDCVYERGTDKVIEGSPSTVATNVFVMVLEPNVDEEYNKVVPLPWQVRSLSTARMRQIV